MTYSLLSTNDLDTISFIAGTRQILTFFIYDSNGDAKDLSATDCEWELARYGSKDSVLGKVASLSGSPINEMVVTLSSTDTEGFSGKFIQQPVILEGANEHRPSQGVIHILPRIS